MQAVWFIRLRQLAGRLKFWSAIVGYDPGDRSIRQRIYLVYLIIFFSLWGFAVLALLADPIAGALSLFDGMSPVEASVLLLAGILLLNAIWHGYDSGRQSPFVFSDEDAGLICQTPVDRRHVALAWLLTDWFPASLPFATFAVVLSLANAQLAEQGGVVWSHFPYYVLKGLQSLSVVLPLHLALMAAYYIFGVLRLRIDHEISVLRWIPVGTAVLVLSMAFISKDSLYLVLWPVIFPLRGGFGDVFWLAGFSSAVFQAVIGVFILYLVSSKVNLSRAAQESHYRWAYQQLIWMGDSRLINRMKTSERLGVGHPASRIPARSGAWALVWKKWVISRRTISLGRAGAWLGIFGASLGLMIVPDWGTRIWAFIIWSLLVSQHGTEQLRSDLELWVISRSLPFSGMKMLAAEIALPTIGVVLLGWLANLLAHWIGIVSFWSISWLIPWVTIGIILSAAAEILHRCRSFDLLAGQVPEAGIGGLVIGLLVTGLPLALISSINQWTKLPETGWLLVTLGCVVSLGIVLGIWRLAANEYNRIK